MTLYATKSIIKIHLIIKIIKTSAINKVAVQCHIIYLRYKYDMRITLFYIGYSPLPEFNRHHMGHIAAETVNTFLGPITQYIKHLKPCLGYRIEVLRTVTVIYSVIQFHRFIPVIG